MKLRQKKSSTRPPIFEHYEHPWYKFNKDQDQQAELLKKPNPPTVEAVEKATLDKRKTLDKIVQFIQYKITMVNQQRAEADAKAAAK